MTDTFNGGVHFVLGVFEWWLSKQSIRTKMNQEWWRNQIKMFSALLALCTRNSSATGDFPSRRPVTRNFDVSFDLRLNKRLSKQSWGWEFETPSRSLWNQCNEELEICSDIKHKWPQYKKTSKTCPSGTFWSKVDKPLLFWLEQFLFWGFE